LNHSRWSLRPRLTDNQLTRWPDLPRLIIQLLYNRGLTEPSQCESFITADQRLVGNPYLLPDIQPAVNRIFRALLSGESIAVYGDFDVDGITGTAVLTQGLESLGGKTIPYIPHRLTEGYGLHSHALEKLHQQGVSLVITVDCGISAVSQIKKAQHHGLDIIVTDHHTPQDEIPPATAVINPKLPGSGYPFPQLSGVGVAYKLMQALFQGAGRQDQAEALIDLVALGTVADMAPLLGENRYLVKQGLQQINRRPRLGLREIITQAGGKAGAIDADTISWVIAPRLNAAGRLQHAISSYQLITTESADEARRLAQWLDEKNTERQRLTSRMLAQAREEILATGIAPLLVAGDKDYPVGIIGLIAARLSDEFYRPAVIIRTGERVSSGSCRSIPEFNIVNALNRHHHLLSHYGGHSRAAGFTLPTENLPALVQSLLHEATTQLAGVDLRPSLDIDAEVTLQEVGHNDTFPAIQQLAPFGQGNPTPAFLTRRVEVINCRTMGQQSDHLRMKLRQHDIVWNGVAFGLGQYRAEVSPYIDIVYNLEIDRWGGRESLRLNIQDFAPSH